MIHPRGSGRALILLTVAAGAAFALILYGPFLFRGDAFGLVDTNTFLVWQLSVNDALRHGEILHWNPHMCGGNLGLADPLSGGLSPFNLIALLGVSPVLHMKVELLLHIFLCGVGFHLICRRLGVPLAFGFVGFCVSAGNGFMVFRILHGQPTFSQLFLTPLLIGLAWPAPVQPTPRQQPTARRWSYWSCDWPSLGAVLVGILTVCLVILEDGAYTYIYIFFLLGVWSLVVSISRRRPSHFLLIVIWAFVPIGLCLSRLLPMAELLSEFPRIVASKDYLTPKMAWDALFNGNQLELYLGGLQRIRPHLIWGAYGAYTGVLPFLLAAGAFVRRPSAAVWGILAAVVLGCLLMFGNFAPWAPWNLVRLLPLFGMVRAPYRFVIVVIMGIAVLSILGTSHGYNYIRARWPGRRGGTYGAMAVAIVSALIAGFMINALQPMFAYYIQPRYKAYAGIDYSQPFRQSLVSSKNQMYYAVAQNVGVINCVAPIKQPNAIDPKRPSVYLAGGEGHAALRVEPNELIVDLDAQTEALVVIQQNYHADWRIASGATRGGVRDENGLLGISVPRGRQQIRLRYNPTMFRWGLALSGIFWLALAAIAWRARRESVKARSGQRA